MARLRFLLHADSDEMRSNRGDVRQESRAVNQSGVGCSGKATVSKHSDWLTKLHEPFFRTQEDAETYALRELSQAVPEGWGIARSPGERLTWIIKKEKLEPGEWPDQEYCLQITKGLDFVILTFGNNDAGPLGLLHHALQNALVIKATMLRGFSLSDCLGYLFTHHKPNEWGYT
jgi:hypothetical protein